MDRPAFDKAIKDALAGYYNTVTLETSPLQDCFGLQASPMLPGHLRRILREGIDLLKPTGAVVYGGPEWQGYRLLALRYLQSRPRHEICEELAISQTTYYRVRRQALGALTNLLWARRKTTTMTSRPNADQSDSGVRSALDEVRELARQSRRQPVGLDWLLSSAQMMLSTLASQHGVAVRIEKPQTGIQASADPAVLRQVLINMLTEVIPTIPGTALDISARESAGDAVFAIQGPTGWLADEDSLRKQRGIEMSVAVLQVYGGNLWLDHRDPAHTRLYFSVPAYSRPRILAVDDDGDTIRYYRRIIEPHGYTVEAASNATEMRASVSRQLPQLITLDVLMPEEDGWDMLQELRATPQTANIPVIVCSVLDQPKLALAMGANHVLNKPVAPESFLALIRESLALATEEH